MCRLVSCLSRVTGLGWVLLLLVGYAYADEPEPKNPEEAKVPTVIDCRYDHHDEGETSEAFPSDDVFRPLIADPKQPQFFAVWQQSRLRAENSSFSLGSVAIGVNFGIYTKRKGCDGWLFHGRTSGGGEFSGAVAIALLVYVVGGLLVAVFLVSWSVRSIPRPLGNTIVVASRVAEGDLSVAISSTGSKTTDSLTESVGAMLRELSNLVTAIRGNAQDAAAMAEEISSSTQEMSASTQEVSSTSNDLTDRATKQATLVRAAAEDATKILEIAETLAQSAVQAAQRNAALAQLARDHRDDLNTSSHELQHLAEEISRGAEEAAALAAASEEIEEFVTQTKAIARQTGRAGGAQGHGNENNPVSA